ncbi:hypothetical protein GCM10010344_43580 [Streptomyces bluensis]|nr:hypothetical protein GCM10010344_43580 [Streptomyces bluensis]
MGRHVTGAARVAVVAPGAAYGVGPFQDDEVGDAGAPQPHGGAQPAEPGADDGHPHMLAPVLNSTPIAPMRPTKSVTSIKPVMPVRTAGPVTPAIAPLPPFPPPLLPLLGHPDASLPRTGRATTPVNTGAMGRVGQDRTAG